MVGSYTQVLADQREEERYLLGSRLIPREAGTRIDNLLAERRVVVITGPRRSGKSTLALMSVVNEEHMYINFDDERLVDIGPAELNQVLEAAIEVYGPTKRLVLDEVQNVRGWELFVNRLQRIGYGIVVTGSNARLLSRELATHLAGRHVALQLLPFSFREYLLWKGVAFESAGALSTERRALVKKHLGEHLQCGGFPEVIASGNRRMLLQRIYEDTVIRDVLLRHNVRYTKAFREIARELLSGYATLVSFNRLRKRHAIGSVHTVKNYIGYLEDAYALFTINKFSYKLKEQSISPKKVYCIDTGMARHVAFTVSPDRGRMLENLVAIELVRRSHALPGTEVYYWRDHAGREVDFVVKEGPSVRSLVQVCLDPDAPGAGRELTALDVAARELRCDDLRIITWDTAGERTVAGRTVVLTPAWEWLLQLPRQGREGTG